MTVVRTSHLTVDGLFLVLDLCKYGYIKLRLNKRIPAIALTLLIVDDSILPYINVLFS